MVAKMPCDQALEHANRIAAATSKNLDKRVIVFLLKLLKLGLVWRKCPSDDGAHAHTLD
jgi:hypothetical protein